MSNWGLIVAYILCVVACIAAIVLPLVKSFSNPKRLLKSGIGIVGILIIFGIGYAFSSNEVTTIFAKNNITPGLSQSIGGMLIATYILFGLSIVGVLVNWVTKLVK